MTPKQFSAIIWGWLAVFLVGPLLCLFAMSFMTRGSYGGYYFPLNIDSFTYILGGSGTLLFWRALGRSLMLSTSTTFLCALLGYPVAYFIRFYGGKWKSLLLFLLVVPFWSNFLIRTYAWFNLLSENGWINDLLVHSGFARQEFLFTPGAVMAGMVYNYLPYMTMSIYMSLERMDHRLLEAAKDLGAKRLRRFFQVTLPLSVPGLAAGSILVFIPSLAEFVIPDILGGATTVYLGGLITQQYLSSRNWPLGSAMSLIMMLIIALIMLLAQRRIKSLGRGDLIS